MVRGDVMPFMPAAYDAINRLEMDAKLEHPKPIFYPITFDGNKKPLRIFCEPSRLMRGEYDHAIVYRRMGLDLTRDQATELIHREQQHASKPT